MYFPKAKSMTDWPKVQICFLYFFNEVFKEANSIIHSSQQFFLKKRIFLDFTAP